MVNLSRPTIHEASQSQYVRVTADNELTTKCPVVLYLNEDGEFRGIKTAIEASNVGLESIGVAIDTIATGASGNVQYSGELEFASGGTKGKGVTAITDAGVVTAATTVTADNIKDKTVKGVCSGAGKMFKLPV